MLLGKLKKKTHIRKIYFYFIFIFKNSDNIDTDIAGANNYNVFLKNKRNSSIIEAKTEFSSEAESINSILVCTGVYQGDKNDFKTQNLMYSHKDAKIDNKLREPNYICDDVYEAVKMVYEIEKFN
jgi:ribonucleotide monophosphatase NagD (HAD superfamily)